MPAVILAGAGSQAFLRSSTKIQSPSRPGAYTAWVTLASVFPRRAEGVMSTFSSSATCTDIAAEAGCSMTTQGLQPQPLWRFFEELSAIPRASYHEEAVLDWIKSFADERKLPWHQDSAGNMVIQRPGMNGGEQAATVIIQGHVDMVTEKNADSTHDFLRDPIRLLVEGDWLTADGTTLGADNGIGVSAALTLLDLPESSGTVLPPLECLFTVEEEVGLKGASVLDGSMVKGRTMLNLDTVEWGSLFVGCAGGGESLITMVLEEDDQKAADAAGYESYRVVVDGLMGGHSGINIHEDRANAIVMLVRAVDEVMESVPSVRLVELRGGDKHNAIPREAIANVLLPRGNTAARDAAAAAVARVLAHLKLEYGTKEAFLSVRLEGTGDAVGAGEASSIEEGGVRRLLSLLSLLPHGVVKMSHDLEGLVETSSNLASVTMVPSANMGEKRVTFEILCSTRSSLGPSLEAVRRRIKTAAELCGSSSVDLRPPYAGWQPDLGSNVLQVARDALQDCLGGQEPVIAALHAGLECGVIGDKAPGMDMVSFGPTILGAHSPDEKVEIASVDKFWHLVLATLEGLAKK